MDSRLQEIAENLDKMKIGVDEPFRFHCDQCGKCCINREDILLNPRDVYNMAKELGQEPKDIFALYCEYYIGSDSRFPLVRIKPRGSIKRCPLMKDRKCSIHKAKPTVCALFPIGRCISFEQKKEKLTTEDITYIFTNPGCGDTSESHTVREWLGEFGIPIEDIYFLLWNDILMKLSAIFRQAEKKVSPSLMDKAWDLTFIKLYLDYDMTQDFLPQFEQSSRELVELMQIFPIER